MLNAVCWSQAESVAYELCMLHVNNAFLMTSLREEEAVERREDSGSARTDTLSEVLCLWCNQRSWIILVVFSRGCLAYFYSFFSIPLCFCPHKTMMVMDLPHECSIEAAGPNYAASYKTSHCCQHRSEGMLNKRVFL